MESPDAAATANGARVGDLEISRTYPTIHPGASTRRRLCHRRRSLTIDATYGGAHFSIAVGFYEDGRIGEVFAHGPKLGSDLAGIIDDACVALSLAMQHGAPPEMLARSMGRLGRGQERASIVGMIADLVAREAGGQAQ